MKKMIRNSLVIVFLAAASVTAANANPQTGMQQGDPASRQAMMQERMKSHMAAMKARLNLSDEQAKKFETFVKEKQKMMQMMMQHRHKMMAGPGSQGGKQAEVGSFGAMMKAMNNQAEQMQATSKAGLAFYDSLSAEQKAMMDKMPGQMRGQMREMMRSQGRPMGGPRGPMNSPMHGPAYGPGYGPGPGQ